MLEAALVIGVLGLLIFWVASLLLRPTSQGPQVAAAGTWRVAHYDAKGVTRVVLQKVREGDTLVILESMKMEIPVIAESDGVVQQLAVNEGDVVQDGDLIAVIE